MSLLVRRKIGGLPLTEAEVRDFNRCINMCGLEDKDITRSKCTWWNGRTNEDCIFKRLDRVLFNDRIQSIFSLIKVEH